MTSNALSWGSGGAATRQSGVLDAPACIDAEEMIIGGCLVESEEAIFLVSESLKSDHFFLSWNATIFRAMLALANDTPRRPTTLTFVTNKLRDWGALEEAGGLKYLSMLAEKTVNAANIEILSTIVYDKYLRRQLIEGGGAIAEMGQDNETDIGVLIQRAEQRIYKIQDRTEHKGLSHISDVVSKTFTAIEARGALSQIIGSSLGLKSGFYDLDALIKALKRKSLIIVGGRPGMGKSMMATSLVLNVSQALNRETLPPPVAFFSLEMSVEEQTIRLFANLSGLDGDRIEDGRLSEPEWETLGQAISVLNQRNIFLSDDADVTISGIRSQARRLKAVRPDLGLIIVDYLQLVKGDDGDKHEHRFLHVGYVARELKRMAAELDVPVIALAQLSREIDSRKDKRPLLSDLRESGEIEQSADLVLFLYRNGYYYPNCQSPNECEVIVAKHRNGKVGTATLLFQPHVSRFANLAGRGTVQIYNNR